jgi:6-pyruvoyl-tetrahydropterin synthase
MNGIKKMIKIIESLPPQILQSFDSKLLSTPMPKFREDSEILLNIYNWIVRRLAKRCKTPQKQAKYLELQNEFLGLYERIKEKEKDLEGKAKHKTQRWGYSFPSIDRNLQTVFRGLRFKR